MLFEETKLSGAFLVKIKPIADERGFFARSFCVAEFAAHGLDTTMSQANIGFSQRKGTLRGMHWQRSPHEEAKLIRCTRGSLYDVIVDLRAGSPTRCQWFAAELTESNGAMLFAPAGFLHGYQTLEDETELCYSTSRKYAPQAATGYRYDDPAFSIEWPLPVSSISVADQSWDSYAS